MSVSPVQLADARATEVGRDGQSGKNSANTYQAITRNLDKRDTPRLDLPSEQSPIAGNVRCWEMSGLSADMLLPASLTHCGTRQSRLPRLELSACSATDRLCYSL